jgi:succinyl-diaminopimelate desuccinylase
MADQKRMLSLLRDLIAARSENPPGREDAVAKILQEHMESHGISCRSIGPSERPNLIFSSHENELGEVVFHGHMDTVPIGNLEDWSHDPFESEIVNGRLYGRGACDMKGPVTAIVESLIQYNEEGHSTPLTVLTTSDEESGCSGAENVAESGLLDGVKFGVCAEPTSLDVLVGEKGMFWSKIVAKGKSAHGSRPEEGINAIVRCMDALKVLLAYEYPYQKNELLGNYTMNPGVIRGGIKINVVPDSCELQLDMRIVQGQTPENLLDLMNQVLRDEGLAETVTVEYVHGKPAVVTPSDAEIVTVSLNEVEQVTGKRSIPTAATYGTDCSVLQPKIGILNVICGPGSIEQAHQPDEFIELDELYRSIDIYLGIARHFDKST